MSKYTIIAGGKVVTTKGYSGAPQVGCSLGDVLQLDPGYVIIQGEVIALVTDDPQEAKALAGQDVEIIDATGRLVIPGFVDCHTHLSFSGYRDNELSLRLSGAPYLDILAAGGGILSTVRKTRAASEGELLATTLSALDVMLAHGTTTVEAKSGYGLSLEDELKQLRVIAQAHRKHCVDVVPTFMGAHAIPPEYEHKRHEYISLIMDQMLPQVASEGLAEFCDCFCEAKAFSLEESRAILSRARELGFGLKLHADEITPLGGAGLAAEMRAVSAEHLIHAQTGDLIRMAAEGVVAVLLPATAFILKSQKKAPTQEMIELGVPIAVSTDYNPGTSPIPNMQLLQAFACYHYGLTPSQAFAASTINAAHAINRGSTCGSLEAGKLADVVILEAPGIEFIAYHLGVNLVCTVVKRGQVVHQRRA